MNLITNFNNSQDHLSFDFSQFGLILSGRDEGVRALQRLDQVITSLQGNQKLFLDMSNVKVLNPSFADESLTPLMEKYPGRFFITGRIGLAVQRGLEQVESQHHFGFPQLAGTSSAG